MDNCHALVGVRAGTTSAWRGVPQWFVAIAKWDLHPQGVFVVIDGLFDQMTDLGGEDQERK
jgi:hypothetical protein